MSTKTTPNPRARGTRLTREMIDQILAGDPVLREDVERRLASQITQPTGETAAEMAHILATLQQMTDDITTHQATVQAARLKLVELAEKTLASVTVDNAADSATLNPISADDFELHLKVLRILSGVLRPAHKAAVEQLDTKLLSIARQSALSSEKQTAVREMADAYGVGRQWMYKLVRNPDAGSRGRPKVSATTADLDRRHYSREEMQDIFNTCNDLIADITELLGEPFRDADDLGPLVEMLKQLGEHIADAQAGVYGARSTLIELAATSLGPITYTEAQRAKGKSASADEYDVHLRVMRMVAGVLRRDHADLTELIETRLQRFAVNAVVSAARNSAVAKVAEAYGAARQNVIRLMDASHPGFLGKLRFGHTNA